MPFLSVARCRIQKDRHPHVTATVLAEAVPYPTDSHSIDPSFFTQKPLAPYGIGGGG